MALDWIRNTVAQGRSKLTEEVGRFKNRETMEAIVAASTAMAFADGVASAEEKAKMVGMLQRSFGARPSGQAVGNDADVVAAVDLTVRKIDDMAKNAADGRARHMQDTQFARGPRPG